MEIKNKWIEKLTNVFIVALIFIFSISLININNNASSSSIQTSSENDVSNKKLSWGIKRADNHEQPDLGSENKRIMDEHNGICIGNSEKPYVYITFDCGYEAGYTEKILEVLKQNDVKATFFITGHYLNSQPDLVEKMINEGHIIGNHTPNYLMSGGIV